MLQSGTPPQTHPYAATAATAIYRGDVLKYVIGTTSVGPAAAGDDHIIGVAAEYCGATDTDRQIEVYDDPTTIFEMQASTATPALAHVQLNADHVATVGTLYDTTHNPKRQDKAGISAHTLDVNVASNLTQLFRIIGLAPYANNAWGAYAILLVVFNEHLLKRVTGAT